MEGKSEVYGVEGQVEPRELVYHDDQLHAFANPHIHRFTPALIVYYSLCLAIIHWRLSFFSEILKKK